MRRIRAVLFVLSVIILLVSMVILEYRVNLIDSQERGQIHISVDDTIKCFEDLTANENKYKSIFDNYTLGYVKELHDKYGATFSFYCYYETEGFELKDCTTIFKSEFSNNSDWLKFGFHAYNDKQDLGNVDLDTFQAEYEDFIIHLEKVVSESALDNYLRMGSFHGTLDICSYLRDHGVKGFYTAEDDRRSYYLKKQDIDVLKKEQRLNDSGIDFIRTDLRLDSCNDPFFLLVRNSAQDNYVEVFTHEWLIDSSKGASIYKLNEVCAFAKAYKYTFVTSFE